MNKENRYYDEIADELPVDISKSSLKYLGEEIEQYLNLFLNVMIIPKHLKHNKKELDEAIKTVQKLIKKLKKGDRSVLKEDI